MKKLGFILFIFFVQQALAQEFVKVHISSEDPHHFYINDGNSSELFYYKMEPKNKPIAVLTILPSSGESLESVLKQIDLHNEALKNDILVILPSYNWGTIQQIPEMDFLDTIFKQVVEEYQVSKDKFIFCGLSNGGVVSLNYGIQSVRDQNRYLIPKGIIGLDPPIDLSRFYKYCEREIERNSSSAGVQEAKWLKNRYEQAFGGSPDSLPLNYQKASIFTYGAEHGGNAKYLNKIPIRMHSDLNIDFLVNQRKRDLYDWNGTDIVAFVNQLKINGNTQAEVIITQNKGKRLDGSLHPHSWSIMDTESTMNWILEILNEDESDKEQKVERYSLDKVFPQETYLEDLNQLVDSIQTYHPQPYEFISKNNFNKAVQQQRDLITDTTTIGEFAWICNSISALVGCLHTRTWTNNLALSPELFFPLDVQFFDSNLYLTKPYAANEELEVGSKILKVNGINVADLKKQIALHLSSDGYNAGFKEALIDKYFGYFCAFQLQFPKTYKIEVATNGTKKEILLNKKAFDHQNNNSNAPSKSLDFTIDLSKSSAIITIKSFVYYNEQLPVFKSFIDSCFNKIDQNQIKNLIIDLRGNGGGDPYCASYLLQYISDHSIQYYKKGTTDVYKDLEMEIAPMQKRFSGKLYILINSLCASTTGHLCSILKQHKIGVLIGNETGATYSCNAYTIHFALKNTGINIAVATKTYQTAVSGFKKNRGITPNYQINKKLEDVLNKRDLELEKAWELISGKK